MQTRSKAIVETVPKQKHEQPMVHLHLTRRIYVVLLLLLIAPWGLLAALWMARDLLLSVQTSKVSVAAAASGRVTYAVLGPWGRLRCTRIAIEPPEEAVFIRPQDEAPPRWVFAGFTMEKLREMFAVAGFQAEQIAFLVARTNVDPATGTIAMSPTPEFVSKMASETKRQVYRVLAAFPENEPQRSPCTFRMKDVEERFDQSGLPADIVADVRRMVYPHEDFLLFADTNILLPRMADKRSKIRLLKTLARKNTLLVALEVNANSNVKELTDYWAAGGRSKDVRPLLESLRRTPGGASVDIAHLLPHFARERIYTFPYSSGPKIEARRDCHWTSLNFFNGIPDDRYVDPAFAMNTIREGYYAISTGARLGDLVLLLTQGGQLVHSAVYVADDIAFTKNGAMAAHPWMLMKIADIAQLFEGAYQAEGRLQVLFYRKRAE